MRPFIAPTVFKLCVGLLTSSAALMPAQAQQNQTLVICAQEGQTCIAPPNTLIHFGFNGATRTMYGATSTSCTNAAFGGDPLLNVPKMCWYLMDPLAIAWTQCANEGGTCSFVGPRLVRYGVADTWVYKSFQQTSVSCSNGVFGDPVPNAPKYCQVGN